MKFYLVPVAVLFLASGCKKNDGLSDGCNGGPCTTDFRTVSVYLIDGSGQSRIIDSTRFLGPDGQPTMLSQHTSYPTPRSFAIAGDEWLRTHPKAVIPFRFRAFSRGQTVVDTPYQIGTDCCHVYKISGPDTIRIR